MEEQSEYESCSLTKLKDLLKQRNVKITGRKKELMLRLIALDMVDKDTTSDKEYIMALPQSYLYTDITDVVSLPYVYPQQVHAFFRAQEKEFDDVYQTLYQEQYIKFLRMARESESTYFAATVLAELSKFITYRCDIHIKDNIISATQCECEVGQGPHALCRHVGTVLFALSQLKSDGVKYIARAACTQKLPSFHRTKRYRVSPKKYTELVTDRHLSLCYDPRPSPTDAGSYQAHFRKVILEYKGDDKDMPVKQLYEAANLHAIANDHSYVTSTGISTSSTSKVLVNCLPSNDSTQSCC